MNPSFGLASSADSPHSRSRQFESRHLQDLCSMRSQDPDYKREKFDFVAQRLQLEVKDFVPWLQSKGRP